MDRYKLTKEGYEKLVEKKEEVERSLKELSAKRIEVANNCGDKWHDNPSFRNLENEERSLVRRLKKLKFKIANAQIVSDSQNKGKNIGVGTHVVIKYGDGHEYEFVIRDPELADPIEGVVSYESPLAKAIIGKQEGDVCCYNVDGSEVRVEVCSVRN